MRFLNRIFNRRIKMLGRAGIIYKNDCEKYFINSECLVAPPYDVVIFVDDISYYDEKKKDVRLTDEEKKLIAKEVKAELESMGMSVELG